MFSSAQRPKVIFGFEAMLKETGQYPIVGKPRGSSVRPRMRGLGPVVIFPLCQ